MSFCQVASHRKLEHILVLLNKYKNNVAVLEQALKNLFTLHRNRVDLGYSSAHIEPQLFEVRFGVFLGVILGVCFVFSVISLGEVSCTGFTVD